MQDASSQSHVLQQRVNPWIRVLKIVIFTLLVLLMLFGLQKWLYPAQTRVSKMIGRIEQLKTGPDLALFGTSTCYCNFVPKYYDKITGEHCLQLGTAGQKMPESLAFLKEMVNQGTPPKTALIYFGVTSRLSSYHTMRSVIVYENLSMSKNKLELLYNLHYTPEELPEPLFKAYRAREFLEERIGELLAPKAKSEESTDYTLPDKYRKYIGNGYSGSAKACESGHVLINESYGLSESTIDSGVIALVDEFVQICKDNGTRLIIVLPPRQPASILLCGRGDEGDYSEMHKYYQKMADDYGVMLWDFNYLYPEIITYKPEQFRDTHHSNHTLAFRLTEVIAEMVDEVEAGTFQLSDYFYDSFDTYQQIYTGIQGIKLSLDTNYHKSGKATKRIYLATGKDVVGEWRVSFSKTKDGEYTVSQDWTTEGNVVLNGPVTGKYMKIEARQQGSDTIEQSVVTKNSY